MRTLVRGAAAALGILAATAVLSAAVILVLGLPIGRAIVVYVIWMLV